MTTFATTRVAILDPLTGDWMGTCAGPEPDGRCSRRAADADIACAGHAIRCEIAGQRRRVRLFVPAVVRACPLHRVPHPWAG